MKHFVNKSENSIISTARLCYKFQTYLKNYPNKTYKGVKSYQLNMKLQ